MFLLGTLSDKLLDIPSLILINEDGLDKNNISDVCKLIRNNEDNSATPIIVLTSNTSYEHEIELLKNEVEYCIKKPLNAEALSYTIKNIIKGII